MLADGDSSQEAAKEHTLADLVRKKSEMTISDEEKGEKRIICARNA